VLASLLIFTGAGSFLTSRFGQKPSRMLVATLLLLMAVLAATTLVTPSVFSAALGLALFWRIAIAIAVIAPLGVLLGMPFPTGLSIVANEAPALVPWAWGVNGFCTVIGSVGAMILSMIFGFKVVLFVAGGCYLASLAAIMSQRISVRERKPASLANRLSGEEQHRRSFRPEEAAVVGH
jgi:MFS family permease